MLVVIDMQKRFRASELVIGETINEIRKARNNKEWIIVIEYADCGRIATRVLRELKDYSKVVRMEKFIDDGSVAVFHAMRHRGIYPRHIKICGVNTSACIMKTVAGLSSLNLPITVISKACANKNVGNTRAQANSPEFQKLQHSLHLKTMNRWKNVKVV